MANSSSTPKWLDALTTRLANRRERLAKVLSNEPVGPAMTWRRQLAVNRAHNASQRYHDLAKVYHEHFKEVAQLTSKSPSGANVASKSTSGGPKRSLGD